MKNFSSVQEQTGLEENVRSMLLLQVVSSKWHTAHVMSTFDQSLEFTLWKTEVVASDLVHGDELEALCFANDVCVSAERRRLSSILNFLNSSAVTAKKEPLS